ncbi:MAG: hypothetical protein U1E53_26055 [Dongiaceae bacterium]
MPREQVKAPTDSQEIEAFRRAARKHTKRATASREAARRELIALGIHTKSGKLTKHYK